MSKKRKRRTAPARHELPSQTADTLGVGSLPEANIPLMTEGNGAKEAVVDWPGRTALLLSGSLVAVVFFWSYWPTLTHLVSRWNAVADYSHGFLVVPLALGILWFRRGRFPHDARPLGRAALAVLGIGLAVRITGARCFLPAFDGWSIPFWLAGVCLLFGGWRLLRWCFPSLVFLLFMVPIPSRAERALSVPLQHVSTSLSCMSLQCLGQPALEEGTRIILGEQTFDVGRDCCGLRMFVGILALATACIILIRRPWWQKTLLLASVVPVAVLANVLRVSTTALLYQYASGEAAQAVSHDAAGWFTNCMAAGLFAAVLWCMSRLFVETESIGKHELLGNVSDLAVTYE